MSWFILQLLTLSNDQLLPIPFLWTTNQDDICIAAMQKHCLALHCQKIWGGQIWWIIFFDWPERSVVVRTIFFTFHLSTRHWIKHVLGLAMIWSTRAYVWFLQNVFKCMYWKKTWLLTKWFGAPHKHEKRVYTHFGFQGWMVCSHVIRSLLINITYLNNKISNKENVIKISPIHCCFFTFSVEFSFDVAYTPIGQNIAQEAFEFIYSIWSGGTYWIHVFTNSL